MEAAGTGSQTPAVDPTSEGKPAVRATGVLEDVARRYPEALRAGQMNDIERVAFHIGLVLRPGARIADLGGGLGLMSPGCAALGLDSWLIDDFRDPVNREFSIHELDVHQALGVHVIEAPVLTWADSFEDESLDVVTCIETLEHWHHSPRPVFEQLSRVLKPGGVFLLGAPNAVNLLNRLKVPFGYSNWSSFEDWYGCDEFRGHVREPVLADLKRLVDQLGFDRVSVWGRNWPLYGGNRARGWAASIIDRMLRPFPTLCHDLYLLARKPSPGTSSPTP